MSFERAVLQTKEISAAYKLGLQALRGIDKSHVRVKHPRAISGSIDLDTALSSQYPNSPRWDYAIAWKSLEEERIYWIEIHPGSTGEIPTVMNKLAWLKTWLSDSGKLLAPFPREFVWVSSGKTALRPTGQQAKQLAVQGLRWVGRHFAID